MSDDDPRPTLLPCPFCGSDDLRLDDEGAGDPHGHDECYRFVLCLGCGGSGARIDDGRGGGSDAPYSRWSEAALAWNRRAPHHPEADA